MTLALLKNLWLSRSPQEHLRPLDNKSTALCDTQPEKKLLTCSRVVLNPEPVEVLFPQA